MTAEERAWAALAKAEVKHLAKLAKLGDEHNAAVAAGNATKAERKIDALDDEIEAWAKKQAKLTRALAKAQALPEDVPVEVKAPAPEKRGIVAWLRKRWWLLPILAIPCIALLAWLQSLAGCNR